MEKCMAFKFPARRHFGFYDVLRLAPAIVWKRVSWPRPVMTMTVETVSLYGILVYS